MRFPTTIPFPRLPAMARRPGIRRTLPAPRVGASVLVAWLLVTAAGFGAEGAAAQTRTDPPLAAGDSLRVRYGSTEVAGLLAERDGDLLFLRPDEQPEITLELPLSALDRVEIWACCEPGESFRNGGLLGAGLAVVAGAVLQLLPTGGDPATPMADAIVIGVPVGFLVGGLLGTQLLKVEAWQPVVLSTGVPGGP